MRQSSTEFDATPRVFTYLFGRIDSTTVIELNPYKQNNHREREELADAT